MYHRMIRRAVVASVIATAVLTLPVAAMPSEPPPGGSGSVNCPNGFCGIEAVDPGGRSGGGGDTTQPIDTGEGTPGRAVGPPPGRTKPPCEGAWQTPNPQPDSESFLWGSHKDTEGHLEYRIDRCGPATAGDPFYRFVPNAASVAPAAPLPPPDPAVVAQSAYRKFVVPETDVRFGPDPKRIAVNMKTWLWVGSSTDLGKESAAAGAVTVTAHARVVRVEWSPGEPAGKNPATGALEGTADTVSCSVVDRAPAADGSGEPGCSYVYKLRSLADRTQGTGTWTLTATAVWEVEWTATGVAPGQATSGVIRPPVRTTAAQVRVGEWRTVGGFGSGG